MQNIDALMEGTLEPSPEWDAGDLANLGTETTVPSSFPKRKTEQNAVPFTAALAWWKTKDGQNFVLWYNHAKEAFANNNVSTPLQGKAQCLERKVENLPRIEKITEQYYGQGSTHCRREFAL